MHSDRRRFFHAVPRLRFLGSLGASRECGAPRQRRLLSPSFRVTLTVGRVCQKLPHADTQLAGAASKEWLTVSSRSRASFIRRAP